VVEATVSGARLGAETSRIAKLKPNSMLELEGVAQIVTSMQPSGYVRPSGFRLLLGGPGDIRLLRAPPWWTPQRLLGLVGALMAVLGLLAVWAVLLRRQVRQQTKIIKDRIEREAVWRDRSRIAQDIHDDLGASLTQVGFLSQRIQTAREHPQESAALADRVVEVSRSTVRALDEIVWAVNPRHDSLQSLADYLVKLASEQLSLTKTNCLLDIPAVLPEVGLRAEIRHNLALAVKEALHNVVKHSRARTLNLALRFEANQVEISIRDDGIGFVRAANVHHRNGLANLERRLAEIGGTCQIETGPGQGTCVRLSVLITSAGAKVES
jgi:signal transduction histidine kinase